MKDFIPNFAKIFKLLRGNSRAEGGIKMRLSEIISDYHQLCSVQGAGEQSQAGALPAGPEEQQPDRGGLAAGEEISGRKWVVIMLTRPTVCSSFYQQEVVDVELSLPRCSSSGGPTPRATPYMAHQTRVRSGEEYNNNNNNNNNEQEDSNAPRGINRLSSRTWPSPWATSYQSISVVADLLQNESVTSLVQKRKEKQGEDSGLESGHTSMNTGKYYEAKILTDPSLPPPPASDTQSDSNSVGEDSHAADTGRTSQHSARNNDFGQINIIILITLTSKYLLSIFLDTFNIKTYQRRHQSRYTNLPVTIVWVFFTTGCSWAFHISHCSVLILKK